MLVNKVLDFRKAYLSNGQGSKQVFSNKIIKQNSQEVALGKKTERDTCPKDKDKEPWRSLIFYVLCLKISPFLKLNITLTIFESRPHQTDSVRWICQVFWEKNKNKDHTQATINKSKLCSGRTSIQLKVALWVKNILEVFLSTTSVQTVRNCVWFINNKLQIFQPYEYFTYWYPYISFKN